MGADPRTPAKGSTPAREITPFRGGVWINEHPHYPIPDLPPYAVRTPHIHGATAYGVTSRGLMMVMLVDINNDEMSSEFISVIYTEGIPMCNQLAPASL